MLPVQGAWVPSLARELKILQLKIHPQLKILISATKSLLATSKKSYKPQRRWKICVPQLRSGTAVTKQILKIFFKYLKIILIMIIDIG